MRCVQIVLNEATKRKSPNALSFGETQREFGDTALVKPHLAITHTRELLGKSAKSELLKIYGEVGFSPVIIDRLIGFGQALTTSRTRSFQTRKEEPLKSRKATGSCPLRSAPNCPVMISRMITDPHLFRCS
jgi:hypothetical protein